MKNRSNGGKVVNGYFGTPSVPWEFSGMAEAKKTNLRRKQ